ncbi:hypothetical protein [uncultured Methanobrevibacter sp.]|uniref:hypothetical protein n=1 Tax=uncultured Methanobrevibacter sp. TaxID=253161 RepID=UPI00320AF3D5
MPQTSLKNNVLKHPDENVIRFPAKQFIDQFIPLSVRSIKQVPFQVVPVLLFENII